jgi:hypothetical protein
VNDGRTNLGGDIFLHGGRASIGCIPVGDDAIEDVFFLVAAIGRENVRIVISPYDMRAGRNPDYERAFSNSFFGLANSSSVPAWYRELLDEIERALGLAQEDGVHARRRAGLGGILDRAPARRAVRAVGDSGTAGAIATS